MWLYFFYHYYISIIVKRHIASLKQKEAGYTLLQETNKNVSAYKYTSISNIFNENFIFNNQYL